MNRETFTHILREIRRQLTVLFAKPRYNSKVFVIGFHKTGTTSCGRALEMLGYRHSSFNKKVWRKYYLNNEIEKILRYAGKFDSVDDLPWFKEDMIPLLDRAFPDSKFIYLTRDEESWKESVYHWTFKMLGQYPDMEDKLEQFRKHREFVLRYFQDRPEEHFLELNVADQRAFHILAEFLGKAAPKKAFPHLNKTRPRGENP